MSTYQRSDNGQTQQAAAAAHTDKYGRKKLCILFGVLYSLACVTKHFHSFEVLMVGRLLGGISTSILFSSFESWMVHEHHEARYPNEWLGLTFSLCMTSRSSLTSFLMFVCSACFLAHCDFEGHADLQR